MRCKDCPCDLDDECPIDRLRAELAQKDATINGLITGQSNAIDELAAAKAEAERLIGLTVFAPDQAPFREAIERMKADNAALRKLCIAPAVDELSSLIAELEFAEDYATAAQLKNIADDMVKAAASGAAVECEEEIKHG